MKSLVEIAFPLLGGLGLFLLGMALVTEGLKAFAGTALKGLLARAAATPLRAFGAGAAGTLLVQSSSATTVAVIGFVSAGLLTFPQAVSVVIGASLGTTGTSWIVSGLGLKFSVGLYALPLVGIGAFARMLGRGRRRDLATAVAGFGMIFVGIDFLQQGMGGLAESWALGEMPSAGGWGRLLALLIGLVMTVMMQSSSGAVAIVLTAFHSGAIGLEQAASLMIGAAIGTTVTGVIAAIGAGNSARRTAMAHVLFNLVTGLIAVGLLPLFLAVIEWLQQRSGLAPGAMSLAAFHTGFIIVGVVIFLPSLGVVTRCLEKLLPDRGPGLTRHLDQTVLHVPSMALEASRRALKETAVGWFEWVGSALESGDEPNLDPDDAALARALADIEHFLAGMPASEGGLMEERLAQVHALDHLNRLTSRWARWPSCRDALKHEDMREAVRDVREMLANAARGLGREASRDWSGEIANAAGEFADLRRRHRAEVLGETATGGRMPEHALDLLDAMRWLDHVSYHCWRASHYLSGNGQPEPDKVVERERAGAVEMEQAEGGADQAP